jgi:hypothetical protein
MASDHWVSVFSAAISFTGLLLVVMQLRANRRQQQMQSLVEIYDINRQLLSLGFSHPKLFAIMEDAPKADPVWERRYLQLWLNQFCLIYMYLKRSVLDRELKEPLERDLADFMKMENIRRHWRQHGTFYPTSFQKLVNGMIQKSEPPPQTAAHTKPT